jgi:hypothetical protein
LTFCPIETFEPHCFIEFSKGRDLELRLMNLLLANIAHFKKHLLDEVILLITSEALLMLRRVMADLNIMADCVG